MYTVKLKDKSVALALQLKLHELYASVLQTLQDTSSEAEEFLVSTLIDLESLKSLIGNETVDIDESVFRVFPKSTHHLLVQAMKINKSLLGKHMNKIQTVITDMKYKECVSYLSKIESVPRLYRRTNRSFPHEPSSYVVSAVDVLLKFSLKYKELSSMDIFVSTLNIIIEQTSNQ